jgi:succinoglycan biosynthesis transport protein ExoP
MATADIYRALWFHRVLVLVVTGLVIASAFVFTSRQEKLYTASSLVRVQQGVQNEQEAFNALLTGERLARTYQRIAETDSIRSLVQARLGKAVPIDDVQITATNLDNLELLEVSATHPDPRVAALVANAVPVALAAFVKKTGVFRDTITSVERASPPTTPSSPNLKLNLVIALMLGLILGGGVALLKESFSDRIQGNEELEKLAGHPVIATIPNLKFAPLSRIHDTSIRRSVEAIQRRRPHIKSAEDEDAAKPAARWSVGG